jgi:hypothetical protein
MADQLPNLGSCSKVALRRSESTYPADAIEKFARTVSGGRARPPVVTYEAHTLILSDHGTQLLRRSTADGTATRVRTGHKLPRPTEGLLAPVHADGARRSLLWSRLGPWSGLRTWTPEAERDSEPSPNMPATTLVRPLVRREKRSPAGSNGRSTPRASFPSRSEPVVLRQRSAPTSSAWRYGRHRPDVSGRAARNAAGKLVFASRPYVNAASVDEHLRVHRARRNVAAAVGSTSLRRAVSQRSGISIEAAACLLAVHRARLGRSAYSS